MHYEEKLINGILHYRTSPDNIWVELSKEELSKRVIETRNFDSKTEEKLDKILHNLGILLRRGW